MKSKMQSNNKKELRNLQSIDYVMCEYDVYCGRGNLCFHHIGNQTFRKIILENLIRYTDAIRKYEKSSIIDDIVDQVREKSRQYNGIGFVRKDKTTGRFYEVSNCVAREKTSQAFRDAREKSINTTKKTSYQSTDEKKIKNYDNNRSDDEVNSHCTSKESLDDSSSTSHWFENEVDDDLCKNNPYPTQQQRSYDSIFDLFKVQKDLRQQTIPTNSMLNKLWTEESSKLESIPVTDRLPAAFNRDVLFGNENIQTRYPVTVSDDIAYSYGNGDDTVASLSSNILDFNHQSNLVSSSSSQTIKQTEFALNRIEELSNPIISDDEKTFNLLFQLTESYPDLQQCPFLNISI